MRLLRNMIRKLLQIIPVVSISEALRIAENECRNRGIKHSGLNHVEEGIYSLLVVLNGVHYGQYIWVLISVETGNVKSLRNPPPK